MLRCLHTPARTRRGGQAVEALSPKLGVACWEVASAGGHGPVAEMEVHATGVAWVARCNRNCCIRVSQVVSVRVEVARLPLERGMRAAGEFDQRRYPVTSHTPLFYACAPLSLSCGNKSVVRLTPNLC